MAIKSLADLLNMNQEQEPMMSQMDQAQQDRLMIPPAQPEVEAPMIPNETPQEQVFNIPKLSDVVPEKPQMDMQQQVPMLAQADMPTAPQKPESDIDRLEKMLQEARRSDRNLKIGGAIGDALATIINAQGQMNVKAPGVQVQQGAGLGKIAEMFATSPEIASDVTAKRKQLLDQYKQMANAESKALDRALKERQIAAYEAQTKAQTKKAEADTAKEQRKESEKLSVGEETLDREFAKVYKDWSTKGKADYEENSKILKDAIDQLDKGKVSTGTLSGIGSKTPGVRTGTKELETRVRKALNGMLRATLGAQFTQEEGERVFQQTFDPFADPKENIKNMQTELSKLEKQKQLIEDQGKFFKQKSTLKGYEIPETLERSEEKQMLPQKDQQALDWANKNPKDPRAVEIKKRLGM